MAAVQSGIDKYPGYKPDGRAEWTYQIQIGRGLYEICLRRRKFRIHHNPAKAAGIHQQWKNFSENTRIQTHDRRIDTIAAGKKRLGWPCGILYHQRRRKPLKQSNWKIATQLVTHQITYRTPMTVKNSFCAKSDWLYSLRQRSYRAIHILLPERIRRFHLRIEDTDQARSVEGAEENDFGNSKLLELGWRTNSNN